MASVHTACGRAHFVVTVLPTVEVRTCDLPIRKFPTHSTAVAQCCNVLSQSDLCFFAQKSD